MYSFDTPSMKLWNALGKRLFEGGFRDDEIKAWLQSKGPRHALDGDLGDRLTALGREWAEAMLAGKQS